MVLVIIVTFNAVINELISTRQNDKLDWEHGEKL